MPLFAPSEIVPLLSGVLARGSIMPFRGLSLPGGLDDQQIVRQHQQSHLDPHTRSATAAEATQTPMSLGIREPQLNRLAPLAVDRLGLGRRHLRLMVYNEILMLMALDRPTLHTVGTALPQRALLTVLRRTTVGRRLQRTPFGAPARLLTDPRQPMPLRADIDLLLGLPDELAL